ncbi:MAG TPA: protein kinase, partial [Thermoanaerobaculaceae bacterium]|nr:protein kinase [Thermoanaerobaculaceae bacterium]
MLEAGQCLGHFELVAPLGRGGMGEVWRARDLRLGREVAVKLLPERLAFDPEYVSRFEREARALAALNHPHVAQIHELAEVEPPDGIGAPLRVIVMELVEGQTVTQRLERGPLPVAEAVRIALQVARALAAVHARGVVHRDLKPSNIVLAAEGDAKVLDFGLARMRPTWRTGAEVDVTAKLTDSAVVVGTASYMAPEQIRGEASDERCDVWGFGCTLAEMLSGTNLVSGGSVPEIAANVLGGRLAWDSLPARLPRALRALLHDCVNADRFRRPEMAEVVRRLEALQRPGSGRQRWPWVLLVTAGVIGAAILAVQERPATRSALLGPDGRLPVAVDDGPGGSAQAGEVATARNELLRRLAGSQALEVVPVPQALVLVRSEVAQDAGTVRLHLLVEDPLSHGVLAVFELPLGSEVPPESTTAAATAVVAGLEMEQVDRELEGDDPYYGFLVRRTRRLEAAQAFRDGVRLAERSRNQEAREAFERALAADPSFWPAPLYLALLAKANARFDEAHAQIARLRDLLPQPGATEAVIIEVASAHVAEDNQRQLEALQRALELFPGSGYLSFRTAQSLRIQDRPGEAIPLLERLLRRNWRPDWSPTREVLAHCQLLSARYEDVLRTCQEGEERFPTRHRYPYLAACALQQLGRTEEARQSLRTAIRKYLDHSGTAPLAVRQTAQYWASLLRWPEERARQWQEVLVETERGLGKTPGDGELQQARGEALVGLGRFAEARPILESLAAGSQPSAYVLLDLARTLHGLGEDAGARQALGGAGDLWRTGQETARGTLAYNIATVWADLGDTMQALEWLLRARDLYGVDRQDLAMDPDLDPLRRAGLLDRLPPRRQAS